MKALGEDVPGYKIRDMIREVDLDENGTVEFNEFLEVGCWERQYFNTVRVLVQIDFYMPEFHVH